MTKSQSAQRGSAVIYIILTMFLIMTSAAMILSGVLSKHIRSAQDYLASERAFAAANSGMEEVLYKVGLSVVDTDISEALNQSVSYGNESASYDARGRIAIDPGRTTSSPCVISVGRYRDTVRSVANGKGVNDCNTSTSTLR